MSDPIITETSYSYDNSQWNDLLTAYDGGKIAYEGQTYRETTNKIGTVTSFVTGTPTSGNPISYYNGTRWTMEWQHGRNLKKATTSSTNTTVISTMKEDTEITEAYTYDADGIRTGKIFSTKVYKYRSSTGGGGEIMSASADPDATLTRYLYSSTTVNHSYITQNGKVVRETIGSGTTAKVLDFIYDESGKPFALKYTNGTANPVTYYYVLNLQGDVVGLIDASGAWVAKYSYNAWGEITRIKGLVGEELVSVLDSNPDHIANLNPLRYRGYYYDTETGFYYLQSRYYDPVTHRFINADSIASTGQGIIGTNMFAYCLNNPVVSADKRGLYAYYIVTNVETHEESVDPYGTVTYVTTINYEYVFMNSDMLFSKESRLEGTVSYSYSVDARGVIIFDSREIQGGELGDKNISTALAKEMYMVTKQQNNSALSGRTIDGIAKEIRVHLKLSFLGKNKFGVIDIGGLDKDREDYDYNAKMFENPWKTYDVIWEMMFE